MNAMHWKSLKKISSLKNEAGCVVIFPPIIMFIILLIFVTTVSIYLGLFHPDAISLLQRERYEVNNTANNLPVSKEPWRTLSVSGIVNLRNMLTEERFDELNAVLDEYQKIFEKDPNDEYKVFSAYYTFRLTLGSYESLFKKWIGAFPDHYQPYLAAAEYYYAKAWKSRGNKWAKETSEQEIQEMRLFLAEAEKNAIAALKVNGKIAVIYDILIGIASLNGDENTKDKIIQKASELFPYSFLIKASCSWSKQPRWGGSYAAMEQIAKDAEKYADKNPRLSALYGYIYSDQADALERDKKYEAALKLIDKALLFGDVCSFYHERAKLHSYRMQQHELAIKDINKSIEMADTDDEAYLIRSRIYFSQSKYSDSLADISTAEALSPGNGEAEELRQWASGKLLSKGYELSKQDARQAVEYYNLSLEFDKKNFETYHWRGLAFNKLNNNELAFSDLKTAIEINPRHFESYRMVDYLLSKNQKWEEIISYWDKFISLEPNHAEAYFERSGSHYHNRDMEKAMNDLKKACDFGSENACKQMKR